jgi:putative ABC transport system permease protein
VGHELRFALRALAARPLSTLGLVSILAVGIGVNVASFLLVQATLFRSLPYPRPQEIVRIMGPSPQSYVRFTIRGFELWPPEIADPGIFAATAVYKTGGLNMSGTVNARVKAAAVTDRFFEVLGVGPILGRAFHPGDDQTAAQVLLSHRLWQREFWSDVSVVGREVVLNGRPFTIVGVMPPGIDFPESSELWISSGADGQLPSDVAGLILARLRPGATPAQVLQLIRGMTPSAPSGWPPGFELRVVSLADDLSSAGRPTVTFLAVVSVLVLLGACVSVASLLLMRLASREREFAVRGALGASRVRLALPVLCEGGLLVGMAATLSVPLSIWTMAALRRATPASLHLPELPSFSPTAALVTAGLGLVAVLAFDLAPALAVAARALGDGLRASPTATARPLWRRFRTGLVLLQVGVAVALLIAGVSIARTVARLEDVDLGVNPRGLLTAELVLPRRVAGTDTSFYERLEEDVRSIDGVQSAGLAEVLPGAVTGALSSLRVEVAGLPAPIGRDERWALVGCATPGYYEAMGIPIVAGRGFSRGDRGDPRVAIVSELYVRTMGLQPDGIIGRQVNLNQTVGWTPVWGEVVGVVRDVRSWGPESNPKASLYEPCAQKQPFGRVFLVARAGKIGVGALAVALQDAASRQDPGVPLFNVRSFDELRRLHLDRRRFVMAVLSAFALLTFALAIGGLYALMAYAVELRRRDLGIRMVVGASPGRIMREVLREGLRHALGGVVIGLAAALAAWQIGGSYLVRLSLLEAVDAILVTVLVVVAASLAIWAPATRATRVDPAEVLRSE